MNDSFTLRRQHRLFTNMFLCRCYSNMSPFTCCHETHFSISIDDHNWIQNPFHDDIKIMKILALPQQCEPVLKHILPTHNLRSTKRGCCSGNSGCFILHRVTTNKSNASIDSGSQSWTGSMCRIFETGRRQFFQEISPIHVSLGSFEWILFDKITEMKRQNCLNI